MMSEWNRVEDVMPNVGDKVWYYFDVVGSHRGTFDGYYVDSEGIESVSYTHLTLPTILLV